jgi:hypothetical protein
MSNFIGDFLYDPSPILPKKFTIFSDLNATWNEAKRPANWTKSQTTKICQPYTQKWENEKELSFEIYAHTEFELLCSYLLKLQFENSNSLRNDTLNPLEKYCNLDTTFSYKISHHFEIW